MYKPVTLVAILAALAGASPLPENDNAPVPSTTIVEVASATSYSSLIMANPSSHTTPSISNAFVTPSNVEMPHPSAMLSFNGNIPSLSAKSSQPTFSESGGVRVVGQTQDLGSGKGSTIDDDDEAGEGDQNQANSAAGTMGGKMLMGGMSAAAVLAITAALA